MPRVITLLLLSTLALYVSSDQIVVPALKQIFPYATQASVKTLTNQVNKQTTIAKAKKVVNNWIPKNWKAAGAKVDAKNQLSKQAYAKNKAVTFIDMRYSLKKYINFLYNQAIKTNYLTKQEANQMRTIFWNSDKKAKNNYTQACVFFMTQASKKIQKTPSIQEKVNELTALFVSTNNKDWTNLNWSL